MTKDKIQLQGNEVFVNGVFFATVETYKGNDRLRLWLATSPADFTILPNTPEAVKAFTLARRMYLQKK